ncbi:GET complex subunit get1 [Malassezia furfur]|uniref:GET complex subunit get1 n=1 Tax=Malassezia furfur TaxID=55194 RepID=A0ABY8ESA5_MALFU|nr:GET complex subunit get1 [Malassezia furfur]
MHPALLIFLVSLVNQTITWLGRDKLQEVCYKLYARVVNYSAYRKLNASKKELFATRQEMNATSAQDQFAKWAKLRRKVDKLTSEVEAQNKVISSGQFFFSLLFKALMFVLNMAIPWMLSSYFSKTPMFYLPPGDWFGPLGYVFSFPKAPVGAVSTTVWTMVCGRVLSLVGAYCREVFVSDPVLDAPVAEAPVAEKPVAEAPVAAAGADEKGGAADAARTLRARKAAT